jgi:PAS domain S-box-containing protein
MSIHDNDEVGEKLNVTLEELRTAEDEIRAQSDQLAAAYDVIAAERQRYHELFHFAPDGYMVTDQSGIIREANLAAGALLDRSRRYLPGKPARAFIHPASRPAFDRVLDRVHDNGSVAGAELTLDAPSGPLPVSVHVNAADHPGSPRVLRWIIHDLTELKAAQERAARADRLAAVGQAAAALGHECRTALQRAKACLSLLRLEIDDRPTALDFIDRTGRAVDDLARMVEDVRLAVSRPHLRCQPCDLKAVWRAAWDQVMADGPAAILRDDVEANTACTADPFRLGQVFANLFDNALAAGANTVVIDAADADLHNRPAVRLVVHNDGPPLTADQRRRMFEPFYTTRPDGTGLGLTIVQSIVEAHGGTVAAADVPAGAEIVLTLPRDPIC